MAIDIKKYKSVDNTVQNMFSVVNTWKDDPRLDVFQNWSIKRIFDYISKTIPYVPDPVPGQVAYLNGDAVEALKSPFVTMFNGGDCDDKSILAACIFEVKKIPYRFVVVSTRPDKQLHHVYLEILTGGKWRPFDATYNYYKLFWENPFTKKKRYEQLGSLIHISEAPQMNTKCRSCALPCLSGRRYSENNYPALLGSNGNAHTMQGVQVAILSGAGKSCNCGGPCCSSVRSYKGKEKRVIMQGIKNIYTSELRLGDPVTAVTAVLTVASSLFGGLFKKEAYQDAYNAWSQAEAQLPGLAAAAAAGDQAALNTLAVTRALIAVLTRDYMNPPLGANFETSPGRQGNRAEWKVIQPEVEAKTAALAPFMLYLNQQHVKTNGNPPMRLEDLVSYYDMFKNKNGLYTQFQAAQKQPSGKNKTKELQFSGAGILLLAGAAALALNLKKKNSKR
jgi:hypothetical protein